MPNLFCRVCGRNLKNPLSIELGIGPVCRGKYTIKGKQGELDFMHAEIKVLKRGPLDDGEYIYVLDIGHNTGRSVTNDAEFIIEKLYDEYGIADRTRIFYQDSQGEIDEIKHSGRKFLGILAGHRGVPLRRCP